MVLYLKIFINKVRNYIFKKAINVVNNKNNFYNNLKN